MAKYATYVSQEEIESTEHEKFVPMLGGDWAMIFVMEKNKVRRKRTWEALKEIAIVLSLNA